MPTVNVTIATPGEHPLTLHLQPIQFIEEAGTPIRDRYSFLLRVQNHLQAALNQFMGQNSLGYRNQYTGEFESNDSDQVIKREDLNEFYKRTQRKRLPTRYERKPVI